MRLIVENIITKVVQGGKDNLLKINPEKSLKKYLSYKVDGYEFTQAYKQRRWDGTKSMLKYGKFPTGMLPFAIKHLETIGCEIILEDHRPNQPIFNGKLITDFAGLNLMDHQNDISKLIDKQVKGIPFYRGVVDAATNAGKTFVIAGLYENLDRPLTLLVVDSKTTYNKTVKEFSEWFDVGEISSNKYEIKQFTVAMVKTLSNLIKDSVNVKQGVSKFQVYMVDECHTAGNATHCHVATSLIGASVRVYFSGTPLDQKNKERKLKLLGNSGPIIKTISNREMMDKGVSLEARIHIRLNRGNYFFTDVTQAMDQQVLYAENRINDMVDIIQNEQKGKQILITFRYHRHGEYILHTLRERLPEVSIGMVHGETKETEQLVEDFKESRLQVLIASTILKQAVNIPCIEVIIMALGGKDTVTIKQFLGRGIRLNKGQTHLDLYDWFDEGDYVEKHSRARIKIYKKEKLEVNFNYSYNSQYSPKNN